MKVLVTIDFTESARRALARHLQVGEPVATYEDLKRWIQRTVRAELARVEAESGRKPDT